MKWTLDVGTRFWRGRKARWRYHSAESELTVCLLSRLIRLTWTVSSRDRMRSRRTRLSRKKKRKPAGYVCACDIISIPWVFECQFQLRQSSPGRASLGYFSRSFLRIACELTNVVRAPRISLFVYIT